jgi:ribosomal protein S3
MSTFSFASSFCFYYSFSLFFRRKKSEKLGAVENKEVLTNNIVRRNKQQTNMNNVNLKALDARHTMSAISCANPLTNVLNNNNRQSSKLIENYFSQVQALASKPIFSMQENKMVINVFYFIAAKEQALHNSTVNSLGEVLSKLYKRPVELRLVRLHYPYLNSFILAQYIAMNTRKYNFKAIMNSLFSAVRESVMATGSSASLPSQIVGLKVKISGRLATQRSVPRQTTQTAQIGTFSSSVVENKANMASDSQEPVQGVVEHAAFTSKNKKGAFTVKVWISQKAHSSI